MTREQIDEIPRRTAQEIVAALPDGKAKFDIELAIEHAMNLEWWRGYHAKALPGDESRG